MDESEPKMSAGVLGWPLTSVPSAQRGEGGSCWSARGILSFAPLGETSICPSANRASGTIGSEKAMRAVLEWLAPKGADEGGAGPAATTGARP